MLRRTQHYNVFYRDQKILLLKIQNKQSLSKYYHLKNYRCLHNYYAHKSNYLWATVALLFPTMRDIFL